MFIVYIIFPDSCAVVVAQWTGKSILYIPSCFSLFISEDTAILSNSNQELIDAHRCINCHLASCKIWNWYLEKEKLGNICLHSNFKAYIDSLLYMIDMIMEIQEFGVTNVFALPNKVDTYSGPPISWFCSLISDFSYSDNFVSLL